MGIPAPSVRGPLNHHQLVATSCRPSEPANSEPQSVRPLMLLIRLIGGDIARLVSMVSMISEDA
jgi:hypothetical protein